MPAQQASLHAVSDLGVVLVLLLGVVRRSEQDEDFPAVGLPAGEGGVSEEAVRFGDAPPEGQTPLVLGSAGVRVATFPEAPDEREAFGIVLETAEEARLGAVHQVAHRNLVPLFEATRRIFPAIPCGMNPRREGDEHQRAEQKKYQRRRGS